MTEVLGQKIPTGKGDTGDVQEQTWADSSLKSLYVQYALGSARGVFLVQGPQGEHKVLELLAEDPNSYVLIGERVQVATPVHSGVATL